MKQITHKEKVMWELYCEYSYIPEDVWYVERSRPRYEWDEEAKRNQLVGWDTYLEKQSKRSAKQWSFIHSKYHYITKVDPIYTEDELELEGFINKLEHRDYMGRCIDSRFNNPYRRKKNNNFGRFGGWRWGRRRSGWLGEDNAFKQDGSYKKKTLSEETIRKREWKQRFAKDKAKTYWKRTSSWVWEGREYKKKALRRFHKNQIKEGIKQMNDALFEYDHDQFDEKTLKNWEWIND